MFLSCGLENFREIFFVNLFPPFPFCFMAFLAFWQLVTLVTCVSLFSVAFCNDGDDNDEDVDSCTEKNTSRDDARVFLFSLFFIVVVDVATAVASVLSSYQQERVFKARATF